MLGGMGVVGRLLVVSFIFSFSFVPPLLSSSFALSLQLSCLTVEAR